MSVFVESLLIGIWFVVRFILMWAGILLLCCSPIVLFFALAGIAVAWSNGYWWAIIGGAVLLLALLGYVCPKVAQYQRYGYWM